MEKKSCANSSTRFACSWADEVERDEQEQQRQQQQEEGKEEEMGVDRRRSPEGQADSPHENASRKSGQRERAAANGIAGGETFDESGMIAHKRKKGRTGTGRTGKGRSKKTNN